MEPMPPRPPLRPRPPTRLPARPTPPTRPMPSGRSFGPRARRGRARRPVRCSGIARESAVARRPTADPGRRRPGPVHRSTRRGGSGRPAAGGHGCPRSRRVGHRADRGHRAPDSALAARDQERHRCRVGHQPDPAAQHRLAGAARSRRLRPRELLRTGARDRRRLLRALPASTSRPPLGVVIADVTGKGIAAALLMAFARPVIHTALQAARPRRRAPAHQPDPRRRAAHRPVHHRAGGSAGRRQRTDRHRQCRSRTAVADPGGRRTDRRGGGWRPDARCLSPLDLEEVEIELGHGDRLLLYTDGVTDAVTSTGSASGRNG